MSLAGVTLAAMSERQMPYLVPAPYGAPIALMQCPVAGFRFHGGEACWSRMRIEDRLALEREPGNRHDARAITVKWQDVMLGYVPREANYALSQMMDRGTPVEGRVTSLRNGADSWQRVMMEVVLQAGAVAPPEPTKLVERIQLWAGLELATPRLKLAPGMNALTPAQRETGVVVLGDCVREVWARLKRPTLGTLEGDRREVRLWDNVALEIGTDGRGLGARYLVSPAAARGPTLTLDLKQPLGADDWLACFVPTVAAICSRRGLTKANMGEPLQHWITASLKLTFEGLVDLDGLRKAALDFLAPDPLARSLANRIFTTPASCEAFNWVAHRASAIALCAVERPAMLPFLRIAQDDVAIKAAADPLSALRHRLLSEGLEPAAWKKLACWGFGAFEGMGEAWCKPIPVARFANLLHRLEVKISPPYDFALHALRVALHRAQPNATLDFERHPPWFMRALLREVESAGDVARAFALERDLPGCLDWVIEARPAPDANQQRAGWPWIFEQAAAHRKARALALAAPWRVPVTEMAWGPYRVVAIRCAAELAAEADAMKNCLATYEDACRCGAIAVYSIRQRSTGARVACFAAERDADGAPWQLIDVAGKMNALVDDELERIGHAMVVKLNGGRGGEVAPF